MKQRILHVCLYISLYSGCATITTPNGGPKDIRPPRLESSIPANKETNFKGKTVELTFNEDVKLNNAKEEILISPSAGKEVEIEVKKFQVTITPKNGWQDTTTYSIFFREGIQDITESNVPPNLKLAFSTGPTIDSLSVIGKVTQLLNGVPADKITVGIYQQDTFDIFTDTAKYFTKTDKRGRFSLDNVKNGKYKIYAFDDKNKNLRVESRTERFGFLSTPIILNKNTDSLRVPLIMMDMRKPKLVSIRNTGSTTKLRFNKFITDYTIEGDTTDVTYSYGDNHTELNFWVRSEIGDSIKLKINAIDSLQNTVDSTFYVKVTNAKTIKDPFKYSLGQPFVDSETGKFQTEITFNKPIVEFNFDSLYIRKDTTEIINLTKDDVSRIDVKARQITIAKMFNKTLFQVEKDEKDPVFTLRSAKGFMLSIDGDTSRVVSSPVPILWPEDTGVLLIEVVTNEKDYIIQLTQGEGKIIRTVNNVTNYKFKGVPAGEYGLRVIVDRNKNNKWDPGDFYKGQEPERVIFYKGSDRKQTFPVRANWELGPLLLRF